MKKATELFYASLFLFICGTVHSQTYTEGTSTLGTTNLQGKAAQFSFLSTQVATPETAPSASVNNAIYIQQIGDENNVVANTRSFRSNINILQRGSNNEVGLDITSGVIEENVFQRGANNRFLDLSSKATISHSAAVFQNGTNQNLFMVGNNSISEKMIVNMRGKNQTVLIRNFKR
ncbi:MAG: hypothetical protein AAF489_09040 [Bacteroidota bacterium]